MRERNNRVRLHCKNCKWYATVRNVPRCLVESNLSSNWAGIVYKKHPDWKNYNSACKDYYMEGKNEEED